MQAARPDQAVIDMMKALLPDDYTEEQVIEAIVQQDRIDRQQAQAQAEDQIVRQSMYTLPQQDNYWTWFADEGPITGGSSGSGRQPSAGPSGVLQQALFNQPQGFNIGSGASTPVGGRAVGSAAHSEDQAEQGGEADDEHDGEGHDDEIEDYEDYQLDYPSEFPGLKQSISICFAS